MRRSCAWARSMWAGARSARLARAQQAAPQAEPCKPFNNTQSLSKCAQLAVEEAEGGEVVLGAGGDGLAGCFGRSH